MQEPTQHRQGSRGRHRRPAPDRRTFIRRILASGKYPTPALRSSAERTPAATFYGVMKSVDGGATWNAMNNGFAASLAVLGLAMDPASPQTLYVGVSPGGDWQYAGIYKTTDGGAHWTQGQWPEPGVTVNTLLVDPERHSRIWAAAGSGVFISLDSGATWSRTPLPHLGVASIAEAASGAVLTFATFAPLQDAHNKH